MLNNYLIEVNMRDSGSSSGYYNAKRKSVGEDESKK